MHPPSFIRDHSATEAEWLRWLQAGAVGAHALALHPGHAQVTLDAGHLDLHWQVLPPRRIALVSLPRLEVRYAFSPEVDEAARQAFMRHFDLHTRRGGG